MVEIAERQKFDLKYKLYYINKELHDYIKLKSQKSQFPINLQIL
jgi:hypothetical protein